MKLINLIPIFALAFSVGCGSLTEKKIEQDIVQQPETTTTEAVASGREAIFKSSNLSAEQKTKMLSLMNKTRSEMAVIQRNEAQAKSSLFKYLAAGKYENREISTYRSKLKKLENQKMNLMFSNLKYTREILGKGTVFDPEWIDFNLMNAGRF